MSTRSLTYIHQMTDQYIKGEKLVCVFYRHSDGYPTGHGQDLADWLKDKKLTNGIKFGADMTNVFNRAGAMAVQLAYHIQKNTSVELIYGDNFDAGQDHDYHIYFRNDEFYIQIDNLDPIKASDFNGEKVEEELYQD